MKIYNSQQQVDKDNLANHNYLQFKGDVTFHCPVYTKHIKARRIIACHGISAWNIDCDVLEGGDIVAWDITANKINYHRFLCAASINCSNITGKGILHAKPITL